ncbi:MAG: helix-turn-helix domain-containing protein [Micromonosporaceae bacterium]
MAASRDLGEFIRELRNNARISLRQLAQQTGVSNPYLSQIERGLRKPSAEVLQQIANALRVSTPLMYLRAGLLAEREGQGVLAAIAADPDLSDRHKKTLVEIYEAFRRENARTRGEAVADPAEAPVASEAPASPSDKTAGPSDEPAGQPDEAQAEAAPVKPSRVVSKKAARRTASVKAGRTAMRAGSGSDRNDHKVPSRGSASTESAGLAEREDMS